MSQSSYSVVIPLYNHQKYITKAIYSVVRQSRPTREIIIIDDGSIDRSADVVRAISEARSDIVFWSQPNRGAHNTINAGLQRATGEYVAILNSDDVFEESRLERALEVMERDREIDLVCSALSFIDGADASITYPWYHDGVAFHNSNKDLGASLINANFIMTTSNFVIRRSLFERIGYFSDLRYTHDLDFLLRMVAEGCRIEILNEPLLRYRLHGNNTISEGDDKVRIEWAACIAMYLRRLWSDPLMGGRWEGAESVFAVLARHNLTLLVMFFLAYFDRTGARSIEPKAWQRDATFMAALSAVAR